MPIQRQVFEFNTSDALTDTGPPAFGELLQARWELLGAGDTGGDLAVYAQQREADTGNGLLVVDDNDCLGVDFQRMWRNPTHTNAGAVDTGDDYLSPPLFGGERPRVRITPGATVHGRLYLWFKD